MYKRLDLYLTTTGEGLTVVVGVEAQEAEDMVEEDKAQGRVVGATEHGLTTTLISRLQASDRGIVQANPEVMAFWLSLYYRLSKIASCDLLILLGRRTGLCSKVVLD